MLRHELINNQEKKQLSCLGWDGGKEKRKVNEKKDKQLIDQRF